MTDKTTFDQYRTRAPELLLDLADHARDILSESLGDIAATETAWELVDRITQVWGGQNLYFPLGLTLAMIRRDLEIYQAFTGDNHSELAQQYHMSVQTIYRIVKEQKKLALKDKQPDLFALDEPEGNDEDDTTH